MAAHSTCPQLGHGWVTAETRTQTSGLWPFISRMACAASWWTEHCREQRQAPGLSRRYGCCQHSFPFPTSGPAQVIPQHPKLAALFINTQKHHLKGPRRFQINFLLREQSHWRDQAPGPLSLQGWSLSKAPSSVALINLHNPTGSTVLWSFGKC